MYIYTFTKNAFRFLIDPHVYEDILHKYLYRILGMLILTFKVLIYDCYTVV